MKKLYIIISVAFLVYSCLNERQKAFHNISEATNKTLTIDVNKDSVYCLEAGMKIKIPKNCFDTSKVILSYNVISRPQDMIPCDLVTETVDGKSLKSYGMVNIQFQNMEGKKLLPSKRFTIISKPVSKDCDIKLFTGKRKKEDASVCWQEVKTENKSIVDFYSAAKTPSGELGFHIKGERLLLSEYLDSVLRNYNDFKPNLEARIHLINENGHFKLNRIDWFTERDLALEKLLISFLSKIEIDGFYAENAKNGTLRLRTNSILNYLDNRLNFETAYTGWINFDVYINSPIARLEVLNYDADHQYRLISKNNIRCERPVDYRDNSLLFEIPIESFSEDYLLYVIKEGRIVSIQTIKMKQETTNKIIL